MQRLLLALSLTSVFSQDNDANACNNLFPYYSDLCAQCYSEDSADPNACNILVGFCQQLGGGPDACEHCYNNKNYTQCAQIHADIAVATAAATAAAADACAVWHPDLGDNCQSCFAGGTGCNNLVVECSGMADGMADGMPDLLCEDCYTSKDYAQCAQNYITIAANACTARHPGLVTECQSCFTGDSDACDELINECGGELTCIDCYNDKNYTQCAQLDAAASSDSDAAAASIAACTAWHPDLVTECQACFTSGTGCQFLYALTLTAADATLAQAAQVCPEVQLGQNGDYSVGPLNCDRIHSVYQNNQCCGTC
jgi:hypothetical protein